METVRPEPTENESPTTGTTNTPATDPPDNTGGGGSTVESDI